MAPATGRPEQVSPLDKLHHFKDHPDFSVGHAEMASPKVEHLGFRDVYLIYNHRFDETFFFFV